MIEQITKIEKEICNSFLAMDCEFEKVNEMLKSKKIDNNNVYAHSLSDTSFMITHKMMEDSSEDIIFIVHVNPTRILLIDTNRYYSGKNTYIKNAIFSSWWNFTPTFDTYYVRHFLIAFNIVKSLVE
jgi:hypothetical protein